MIDLRDTAKQDATAPLRGDRCQCPSCHQRFNSTYAFDRHRIGQYESTRRCLTNSQMLGKGMARNKAGFWVSQSMAMGRGGNGKGSAFVSTPWVRAPQSQTPAESLDVAVRAAYREVSP
jgi:hypothetical protein